MISFNNVINIVTIIVWIVTIGSISKKTLSECELAALLFTLYLGFTAKPTK
jgi:hypothetical protein